jgi:hypothetical protein
MSTNDLNSGQQTFDRIEQSYLITWCRFHPEAALEDGVEDYAGKNVANMYLVNCNATS